MSKKIKIYHTFINKKGEVKTVNFLIERETYEVLQKVNKAERDLYLLDEYRNFCKEQKYKRRIKLIDPLVIYNKEDLQENNQVNTLDSICKEVMIKEKVKTLNSIEKSVIFFKFFKKYNQMQIAKELNISDRTVRRYLENAINKLKCKYQN